MMTPNFDKLQDVYSIKYGYISKFEVCRLGRHDMDLPSWVLDLSFCVCTTLKICVHYFKVKPQ